MEKQEKKKTIKKLALRVRWSTAGYALLTLLVLALIALLVVAYAVPRHYAWAGAVADKTPLPLAVVGGQKAITFTGLAENMRSIRSFYENQDFSKVGLRVDFSTPEGQKRFEVREKEVLNKMIEDDAIMLLARKRGIRVTKEEASEGVRRKLQEYGTSDQVQKDLARLYGWTLADFEQKVVVPALYEQKLRDAFQKEADPNKDASAKIDQAHAALQSGQGFAETAKQYSDGQTASSGGELGWFDPVDLAPELQKPVALQKVGVPGEVIESSLGYHILLVEEVKKENDKQLYRLSQIFTKKLTFADWLSEQMKHLPVFILTPEYRWNVEEARADFRDQEMQQYEKALYEKTSGDALFFF